MTKQKPWLKNKNTKEIEVEGCKLTVKPISFGASRDAVSQAIDIDPMTRKTKVDATLLGVLRALAQIQDWDLTDEEDKKLPITLATFDEILDEEFAGKIVKAVQDAQDEELTEEEKK